LPSAQILGFEHSRMMTNREVQEFFRRIPDSHITNPHLTSIEYVDQVHTSPGDERQQPERVFGQTHINLCEQTSEIKIFRQKAGGNDDIREFQDSLLHEVGHVVFQLRLTEEQRVEWHIIHARAPFHFTSAGSDPVEHFAEAYAAYILRNELLRVKMVPEHTFMETKVF
jgi:hypothetical protein